LYRVNGFPFKEVYKGGSDLGVVLNKTLVEPSKAKEYLDIPNSLRLRLSSNSTNPSRFYFNPFKVDNITQKTDTIYIKSTFSQIGIKIILLQLLKYIVNILGILFRVVRVNENVI
jgi:hypothetical protein